LKTGLNIFGTTVMGMYVTFLILIVSIFPSTFGTIGFDYWICFTSAGLTGTYVLSYILTGWIVLFLIGTKRPPLTLITGFLGETFLHDDSNYFRASFGMTFSGI